MPANFTHTDLRTDANKNKTEIVFDTTTVPGSTGIFVEGVDTFTMVFPSTHPGKNKEDEAFTLFSLSPRSVPQISFHRSAHVAEQMFLSSVWDYKDLAAADKFFITR